MSRQNNLLLLTATVTPRQDQPKLVVVDPVERLAEYRKALAHYVQLLGKGAIDAIVFAENSGYDLSTLAEEFPSPQIEWLSIDPGINRSDFHRGYAEFKLIDAALERSQLLRYLGPEVRIWKVSGRYIVRNLHRVVNWAPRKFDLYGSIARGWFEMSVLAWSPLAHRRLIQGVWNHFATAESSELILYRLIQDPSYQDLRVVRSLTWPTVIEGRRGADGSPYQGRRTRYRFLLIALGKLLFLPWRHLSQS